MILVGTKMDLRTDQTTLKGLSQEGFKPIEQMEGKAVAKEMKLVSFVKCSAMRQIGITEVFDLAVTTELKRAEKGLRKDSERTQTS
jgi:Ras-related C3 botulinum toxin substrate 1